MHRTIVLFLAFRLCWITAGCDHQDQSRQRFESLRSQVIAGQYDQAIPHLEAFVKRSPKDEHASRAGLFLFKAYFAKQDYVNAQKWCDWTIDRHSSSLEAKKCQFKKGLIFFAQQNYDSAIKQFQSVADDSSNPLRAEASVLVRMLDKTRKSNEQGTPDP